MTEMGPNNLDPGDEPPLTVGGRRPPDRREVSARWLAGTFLTGVTSCMLIGVALFAALDGREQLATPPEILARNDMQGTADEVTVTKGGRLVSTISQQKANDRRRFDLSTMQKVGEREVIRTRPFELVHMALAVDHPNTRKYPAFNAMTVFSEGTAPSQPTDAGQIYGAKVESEVSLHVVDFPLNSTVFDASSNLTVDEVEKVVRDTGGLLTDGDVQVASLHYVDPARFGGTDSPFALGPALGVKITQENVSVAQRGDEEASGDGFSEELIPFRQTAEIAQALEDAGYDGDDSANMADSLAKLMNSPRLKEGSVLRVGTETRDGEDRIVRASIYNRTTHLVTVALNDRGQYVPSDEPEETPLLQTAFDGNAAPAAIRGNLPTVYDGVSRAALAYGMTETMREQLIKMLASDVDLQSRLSSSDQIDAFFSLPDDPDKSENDSQLLYIAANFSGTTRKFYRYQAPDGSVDYFNPNGKSAKQFLLRNPVPNGVFRSPFGMRRHPILGYSRMHTGVDWAAPRGTPIIAAGNGVVEKAGWSNGYGNQTLIRHANGYVSSYNHQNAIARGVRPGARVRQGQVIGYVGSTGLSTGPHLHYELIVNGTKVDPLRIRLPDNKALSGKELEAFKQERDRIDVLLNGDENGTRLASNGQAKG
ncbi:murein DD-endopeptidase MepM/ murein hydrolase activator NlpD [Ochrobactrum daejeonense]|uniref:Murein DD-endopeptidase MepM/ murein hydrolase activator NlpD n=1 Tax=Brucella daejeonensis TaxID=659015 RepID=A0A7W9B242_9HYPH|nr:M23 family metallopeptidase [Brucella daejeonensis]MBB5704404.1 murein DD-endopeptidase MepM/ murein hydrolase activator NlpD [Brucella daejeonensis]